MNDHSSENTPDDNKNAPAGNAPSLNEQLVAYLDGELDAETSRRIEAQLASNAEVRHRLQSLERTWELLDDLDAAPTGEPFTRTTLEMVALAAGEDLARSRLDAPRRRRRRQLQILGVLAAAAAFGFLGFWLFMPDPNRRLLDNLPLLEQFDEYHDAGNIALLRQLRKENLFPPKTPSSSGVVAAKPEDTASRRRSIERMKPEQKAELARVEERFDSLPPEERNAMRKLHDDLRDAPDGERLRAIMHDYCEWLKTLSQYSWFELNEIPSGERLKWVKEQLKREQPHEPMFRPSDKDAETSATWLRKYVARHTDAIRKLLNADQQRNFSESNEEHRRHLIEGRMMQAVASHELLPMMTDADLSQLRGQLSDATRKQMEGKPSWGQWRMAMRWAFLHNVHGRGLGGGGRRGFLPGGFDVDLNERLADFFEKTLTPDQRDRLLDMPSDQMLQRLRQMYQQSHARPPEGLPRRPPDGEWREHHHPNNAEPPMAKKKTP